MKDVELPPNAYFGISSATGDLVDNHDIMQFTVGSLEGVVDPIAHHESWVNAQDAQERAVLDPSSHLTTTTTAALPPPRHSTCLGG